MFYFNKMKQEDNEYSLWNHHIEEVVKDIGESSKAYKTMHNKEARNANDKYNRLMLVGIISGPLAGIISAVGSSINLSNYAPITITQIILGFLSGIFIAILRYGKYDEVSSSNKSAAAKYASLESNVRRQLSLYRKDRFPAVSYLEWTETKYDDLVSSAPLLSNHIFEEYSVLAKQNNWKIPGQYSDSIDINQDYEDYEDYSKINEDIESCSKKEVKESITRVSRTNTMSNIPEINSCSDQMLNYEMKRFMNIR